MSKERSLIKNGKNNSASGFSAVEGIFSVAVLSVLVLVVVTQIVASQRMGNRAFQTSKANYLAQEGLEAVKNIRDADFFGLANGTYGLQSAGGQWSLSTTAPEIIENFYQRQIVISSPDQDTRQVAVSVQWETTNEVKLVTQFKNWLATVEDWSMPTYDGDFDLTAANSGSNNHKISTVLVNGNYLYVGNDNSAGKEFLIFDLTKAPTLTIKGGLNLDGKPKHISVFLDHAFLVSSSQEEELQVVDISDVANPKLDASFDLLGQSDALSIDISSDGQKLALGRQNGEFYVFDISNPENPILRGQLDGLNDVNEIRISGNYAFVAAGDGTMKVIDISDATRPTLVSSLNLQSPGTQDCSDGASSLDLTSARAYVGCYGGNKFFVINIENPVTPLILSSGQFSGINLIVEHVSFAANDQLVFFMTSDTDRDFQVWSVANDLAPSNLSTVNLAGSPSQADYSPLVQKMFVGLISNPEIQIVAPQLIYE